MSEGKRRREDQIVNQIIRKINDMLTNSSDLQEQIKNYEEEGFDIKITIITAISIDNESEDNRILPLSDPCRDTLDFDPESELSSEDKKFLASLKLTF